MYKRQEATQPEQQPAVTPAPEKPKGEPIDDEGNAHTRDLLYDKATNKQFITVQTKNGNTFFIVIDYDAPVSYTHLDVYKRQTINRAQHKATRYYMDEFHLLLKEEQTAAYSVEIWKRFRKWGGIPTGITQNVKDLLASREVENIFENSDFVYLLNQASGDRQILSKALNISPSQQNYITNSNAGEGLIFYGSTIVPFKDDFPKDTQLYRIMTTRLEETVQN